MEDSVFVNGYDMVAEEDYYKHFFGDDWEWDYWNPLGGIDYFTIPPTHNSYNRIHVLKPGAE